MIERRCIQNRSHASGLRPQRVRVESPIDPRMTRAAWQGRSSLWSVSDAGTVLTSGDDRAFWRKVAQMTAYPLFSSGQTGMCPRAHFPNPATRSKGGAL
jgi:hypothetical protein